VPTPTDPDVSDVTFVLGRHLPGIEIDSVTPLGEGTDNRVFEVNGELVVRFVKDADALDVEREAELLRAVRAISPLPVPTPRFVDPELGCLAYTRLPGVPLLDMPVPHRSARRLAVAERLGELLSALHAAPLERMGELAGSDAPPLAEWRDEAARTYSALSARLGPCRPEVQAFLQAPLPPAPANLAFSHNDLGIEHVLVDPSGWTPTGIIDWTDAAIVDPARDFGLVLRDLGPEALDAGLRSYRAPAAGDEQLAERALFYARCSVFEDLAYGLDSGRAAYVEKSMAALEWLFGLAISRRA
jgi:aminoglycoside phosphotransferase (APT) family kinase protein